MGRIPRKSQQSKEFQIDQTDWMVKGSRIEVASDEKKIPRRRHRSKFLYHEDCIKAMEELRSNYSLFYSQLLEFVNDLNNRLIPDAPPQLQYVTILPDILPEDDPDFQSGNEDSVIGRAFIVKKMTLLVLARTRQFVDEGSHGWYDDQAEKLNMWLGLVNMSLANLRLSDEESSQSLEAGIGGLSTGSQSYRQINVDNLRELQNLLIASAE
ncbi:hypothetical protein RRG08_030852 [Elysia crispata]|uniref:Uncharacterized protein n=1 Tax=Elysia crispata TaxID=231223 RepID=A0AAE0XSV1_9GAST|nr:hypothetical protein RRG08_030852 [Elysia crispata]